MAVPAGPTEVRYVGNGVTKTFTIPFLLILSSDLDVFLNGSEQGSGYVIAGAGNPTSSITFTAAPAVGVDVYLVLNVPFERLNDYQENGDFLAATVNRDFDRIWQALKQLLRGATRALTLGSTDVDGSGWYRAKGNGIRNLADPINEQDAVNQRFMRDYVDRSVSGIVGGLGFFLQIGVGAVQRTFQSKMRDIFNTRDFGVAADGTDQGSKMQAAINAADAVDVASGTFLCEQTVRGNGKKLNLRGSVRAFNSLIPESLAHDQVVPGLIIADSYTPFDYSRFGRMDPTILAYGDSNTAWVDATSTRIGVGQGSWPAYLEAHLAKYPYFALGRVRGDGSPGRTSQFALDNFDLFMATYDPQVAILGWGTNDIAQGVSRATYLSNMALLIERFRQRGVLTIVLGIPWHGAFFNESKAWNSSLATLCQNYGVEFVPVYTVFANASSTYFAADGIHYTVVANQVIAEIVHDIIVKSYGIPKNKMIPFPPRPTSSQDPYSWTCEGIRHSNGMKLQIVQTPDVYVRRLFPYAIKIDAGQEVSITAAGPFSALFDYPDSIGAAWTLNGNPFSPVTRGTVIKLNSTSPRLDGSSSSFRVGCTSGSIYLVATQAEFGFPARVYSTAEIRNGLYVPGQIITIADATHKLDTIMAQVSGVTDVGYAVDLDIANVGPVSVRTAITSAPVGFKFFQPDDETWWRWDGAAWVAF
ncbi:GDSL-like Lipase/Acylhydrolase [compost metagenome]